METGKKKSKKFTAEVRPSKLNCKIRIFGLNKHISTNFIIITYNYLIIIT